VLNEDTKESFCSSSAACFAELVYDGAAIATATLAETAVEEKRPTD